MTELEKFKRRMIRMVARLHVQEKKPEDELWDYLRKQTKCDCKWLWERMRALTLKRLKRLLVAEDRQENIPAVARMSLTDWLLFDCILVHEKIDVIGQELIAEGRSSEPRPMFELFSLVQRFELEGLRGEELARAWTAATVAYNSTGRQCSPMLLQRRWYQLKEVTREKFYKFWFSYRGNAKYLTDALKDKPSRLQAAVAKRYPHIITTSFLEWEDLIEKKLIVMPPEFEIQMKSRSSNLPKPIDENDSDLILLEPEIETIDLGVDSDTDDDLRDEVEGTKATQMMANENMAAVQSITLKQEPLDEDYTEEGIDLDSAHMEAIDAEIDHMEGIEALENIEIPIKDNTDLFIEDYALPSTSNQEKTTKKKMGRPPKLKSPPTDDVTEDKSKSSSEEYEASQENVKTAEDINSSSIVEIPSSPTEDETRPEIDVSLTTKDVTSDPTISSTENSLTDGASPMAVITPKKKPTEDPEVTFIGDSDGTEPTEMPQITNVFGNVNIPDEALQKLSSYLDKAKNATPAVEAKNSDDEIEEDIIKTEIVDDTNNSPNVDDQIQNSNVTADENNESETKNSEEKSSDNFLGDIIPEVTFEDDGIEFIDDGIVEDEGEHAKDETKPETSQSIDLKLLMVPVVYTRKLEDMDVLKNKSISHVKDIESIYLILTESKPESKKSMKISEEQPENKTIPDDEEDAHDDLFDKPDVASGADSTDSEEETIPEEKKVAVSSVLFKKPRNRDYGPLVICKNPDFNTRLKRLTVGFLSYTRNRFLLRACKPLTIDLCTAFESKLLNNTIYLKQSPVSECVVQEEKPDASDGNSQAPLMEPQENLVQVNVVPTTNSVQNLIDNMHAEKLWSPPALESNKEVGRLEDRKHSVSERNKVINLPNIDNVRRINQKLLVAEVSPMRVENLSTHNPPVSLLTQSMDKLNLPISDEGLRLKTPETEVTSGKVIFRGQVINNVTYAVRNYRGSKTKTLPWRPEAGSKVYRGFWNSKKSKPITQSKFFDDQLLTVDTLNKMLHIVHQKDPVRTHEKAKYMKSSKNKQADELQKKVNEIQRMLTGESSTDENQDKNKQAKGTSKQTQDEKNKTDPTKPKRGRPSCAEADRLRKRRRSGKSVNLIGYGYGTHCCWARFKQLHPDNHNVHPCRGRCVCCCVEKQEVTTETDPSILKVCESIESVIEQSREILDNEIFDKDYLKNKDNITQEGVAVQIVNKNSATESSIVAEENSVIDITGAENDGQEDKNDDTECDIVVMEKNNIETTDVGNDTTGTLSSENNKISNDSAENTVVEDNTVAANITIPVVNQDQAVTTDDCVLIDSDESDAHNLQPPPVKISVSYADQDQLIKRRRGRPIKMPERIPQKYSRPTIKTPILQLEPRANNRFNLRPIPKKKDNELEKNVLFMKSTHIAKKSNHPIFLGKNKILLTDVPLLRNKDKPVQNEQAPALINTALPLPQGVNMILLPNGVLTCTIDPDVQLSPEEIANLGLIVENVQKQINYAVSGVTAPGMQAVPTIQVPTMQVIPAMQPAPEIPAVTVETENSNNAVNLLEYQNVFENSLHNKALDKISTVECVAAAESSITENISSAMENIASTTENVVSAMEGVISATENIVSTTENVVPASASADLALESAVSVSESAVSALESAVSVSESAVSASESAVSASESVVSVYESAVLASENTVSAPEIAVSETGNVISLIDNAIDGVAREVDSTEASIDQSAISEPTVQDPVEDATINNNVETDKDKRSASENTSQTSEEEKNVETEPAKKKTILSDLMEMSGIFDEDIAPIAETTQVSEVTPPPLHIPAANLCLPQDSTNSLPELTPITSFWELRYACSQNGNFFKLDLITKTLTPINVCIKKKHKETPKQFVDLTEDDEENLPNVPHTQDIQKKMVSTNIGQLPVYIIRKNKNNAQNVDQNKAKERSLLKILEPAKPLKLFKVVHPFSPNVNLLQKQKNDAESSYDIVSAPQVMSRMGKRSRKQNLTEQVFETPTLNFLASDEEKEDYEFDGSFEDIVESIDDSDSSDDEPLAKKVRRKEEMAKQAELAIQGPLASKATEVNVDVSEPVEPTTAVSVPENSQDESMESEVSELPLPIEGVDLPSKEQRPVLEDEELEEAPTEIQFMSDHDDDNDEDDCILGF